VSTRYERLQQRNKKDASDDVLRQQRHDDRASNKKAKKSKKQKRSKTGPEEDSGLMADGADVGTSGGSPRDEAIEDENVHDGKKKKKRRTASRTDKGVWPPLFLFPEGGNSSAQGFISFKLGAFNPGTLPWHSSLSTAR
jgi:hypothetical protein